MKIPSVALFVICLLVFGCDHNDTTKIVPPAKHVLIENVATTETILAETDEAYEAEQKESAKRRDDEAFVLPMNRETKQKCVEMCDKLGPFNAEVFSKKYKIKNLINDPATWDPYFVWSLAEEACIGGRFGKPNRELAFQLVIRGGEVTAEFESAIEEAYKKWKNREPYQFVIDDHITSGIGGAFCSGRKHDEVVEECQREMNEIGTSRPAQDRDRLAKAYGAFTKFIEEKAWTEEGHGGTGWIGWTFDSLIEHKREYVKLVKSVSKGFNPDFQRGYQVTDQKLNETYKTLIDDLKKTTFKPGHTRITHDMIIDVQRLWIPYRDSTAELFSSLNPAIDKMVWKSWLTDARTKQLEELFERKKSMEENGVPGF